MSSFSYDAENRLVAASGGVSLVYDPLGRLFQVSGGSGTTQFLYDGDALVAEYNGSGTMLRRYVHGAGADVPLVWYEGAGLSSKRFLYPDSQGSIVAVTDGAASVTNVNSYDEYGIPAAGNTGRFQYTGQAWIPELGMYHYKARVYSPVLGRFLQTDPIGYEDHVNLYAYVGNDPVNGSDPLGMFEVLATNEKDARVLEKQVSELAAGEYRFNKDLKLEKVEGGTDPAGKPQSASYAETLDRLIASPDKLTMEVASTLRQGKQRVNIDEAYGGGVTIQNGKDAMVVVTGRGSSTSAVAAGGGALNQAPSEITMHEIVVHGANSLLGTPETIGRENQIRAELKLPLRGATRTHPEK